MNKIKHPFIFLNSVFLSIQLIIQTPVFAESSYTSSTQPTSSTSSTLGSDGCNSARSACSQYGSQSRSSLVATACPTDSAGQVISNGVTYASVQDCENALGNKWDILTGYCEAEKKLAEAETYNTASAALYTAAAAACFASAGAQVMAISALQGYLVPVLGTACTAAGITGLGVDIAANEKLKVSGENFSNWQDNLDKSGLAMASAAAVSSIVGGLGAFAATRSAITTESGNAVAGPAFSSAAGAFFVITAGLKFKNLDNTKSAHHQVCDQINSLPGYQNGSSVGLQTGQSGKIASTKDGSQQTGSSSTYSSQGVAALALESSTGTFPPASFSAATAGDSFVGALNQLPNKNEIPDALSKLGTSLGAIAGQIAQGKSPSSIISNILPDTSSSHALSGFLSDTERLTKDGKITSNLNKITPTYARGGGQMKTGESSGEVNPFSLFSNSKSLSAAPSSNGELKFDKSSHARALANDDDIWHSKWTGSIFQIISTRLDSDKNAVDHIEWTTPLNRALMGLPKLDEKKIK